MLPAFLDMFCTGVRGAGAAARLLLPEVFRRTRKSHNSLKGNCRSQLILFREWEHFYSLFISLSWASSSTVTYSAWKHRLSLVLQTQRGWFKGLRWQSLLPGVDLLISQIQGKGVGLHRAVMQGEIMWWVFTSGLTLLLLCFKYIPFKEMTLPFHWCKWDSDHICCITLSRYTNWKGVCVCEVGR